MPISNPQASLKIRAQLLPDSDTEPNVSKELELLVERNLDVADMEIAYSITITAATLSGGHCVYSLDLQTGDVSGVTGSATVVRSGKDAFGNDLPSGQAGIGAILIESGAENNTPVKVTGSATESTLKESWVRPGKMVFSDSETASSDLSFDFQNVGDTAKITVLSTTAV